MEPRLLTVAHGGRADRTPVWLMRQAGRYLEGYQRLRAKYSFLDLCKNSELSVEISLEPFNRFGVDGVILFSDIMVPAEAMGIELDFCPGPVLQKPIRSQPQIEALQIPDPFEKTPFVLETLRQLKRQIDGRGALIGFCGGPFTTAMYLVEGQHVENFPTLRKFMKEVPDRFCQLLEKLTQTLVAYMKAQIAAGADLVQIFDSGTYLLNKEDYLTFAYPYEKQLLEAIKSEAPTILYVKESRRFLEEIRMLEPQIVSIDTSLTLSEARECFGKHMILQGNLDPVLLRDGSPNEIQEATRRILSETKGERHIFNLGHGVLKGTPVENVAALVEQVQRYG